MRTQVAILARNERNRAGWPTATDRRRLDLTLLRGPRQRILDADQAVSALKPVIDGLRDAGWIVDDRPHWLDLSMPDQVIDRTAGPAVRVTITSAGQD